MTEKILGYTRHPASAVWPDLDGEEFSQLLDGIEYQGQLQPILATEEKEVFDGWQRLRACKMLNMTPVVKIEKKSLKSISDSIVSLHAGRRHLGAKELARMVLETRLACGEKIAEQGQHGQENTITRQSLADDAKVSKGTAGRVLQEKKQELNPDNDPFEEETETHAAATAEPEPEKSEDVEKGDEQLPDPEAILQSELEETQARLEDANERLAILEEGVSPESKALIDDLNNKGALILTLRSQLHEKTVQLNEAKKTIAALKRRVKKLEA